MAGDTDDRMPMTTQKILVTGASGFLGLAVCRALVDAGIQAIGTWHQMTPAYQHSRLEWVRIDLSAAAATLELHTLEFDTIIHLAAAIPARSVSAEDAANLNRVIDSLVFRAAASKGATVLYASGTSVYGELRDLMPVSEDAMVFPPSPYPRAKLESERLGTEISDRAGTRFVALRICAPYGPGQKTRTVIQMFVENALEEIPLQYFGSGTREQAFTFVSDVADAFVLASHAGSGCYNIAGYPAVKMRELALLVAEQAGVSSELVRPADRSDPQDGFTARFDVSRAARELGWSPKVSLRDGISRCIAARRAEQAA